jgi:hypothetical protein
MVMPWTIRAFARDFPETHHWPPALSIVGITPHGPVAEIEELDMT